MPAELAHAGVAGEALFRGVEAIVLQLKQRSRDAVLDGGTNVLIVNVLGTERVFYLWMGKSAAGAVFVTPAIGLRHGPVVQAAVKSKAVDLTGSSVGRLIGGCEGNAH